MRDRLIGWLLAVGAVACATPVGERTSMNVVSFNIRYGTANDGENAWANRRDRVVRTLRDAAPAVVGLQEALRFQLDELAEALPEFAVLGVGRDDGRSRGEYAAILYDTRALRPLEHETFWLSDTPEVVASKHWGNRITRICTWARFECIGSGETFYVFNTHWDHVSQPSRERSADLIVERIQARTHPDPVLLFGDFNAGEGNAAFRRLIASGLRDTFRDVHPGAVEVGTFNGFRGRTDGDKIDAVLVSEGWQVRDASIVRSDPPASDHFAVTATVALTR